MAGRIGYEDILGALARRYDFHSAHAILGEALAQAGLAAAADYSPEEASRIVWGLNTIGQRAQQAVMALLELVGEAATADLPDDEDGEEEQVEEADLPWVIAQVVNAAVCSAQAKARARVEQARTGGNADADAAPGPADPKSRN